MVGRGGGMIQSIYLPFKLGLGGPMGSGQQIMPWIHIDDLCGIIKHSIECQTVNGVLNAVAPEIVTNGEFSKVIQNRKLFNEKLNRKLHNFVILDFCISFE